MAQSKSKKVESEETELILVSSLKLENILKDNNLLFEAISLSRFIVIEGKYKIMVRSEEIASVQITNHIIIHLKSGQIIEIGE